MSNDIRTLLLPKATLQSWESGVKAGMLWTIYISHSCMSSTLSKGFLWSRSIVSSVEQARVPVSVYQHITSKCLIEFPRLLCKERIYTYSSKVNRPNWFVAHWEVWWHHTMECSSSYLPSSKMTTIWQLLLCVCVYCTYVCMFLQMSTCVAVHRCVWVVCIPVYNVCVCT